MKKITSIILSIILCMGMVTAVNAAVAEVDDALTDTSNMFSSSSGLIFETKKLGSYVDATYATSNVGEMEVVYELEDMSYFEIVTLNYNNTEDISFYTASSESGEYTEITDYSTAQETLGSSWTKTTYSKSEIAQGSKYLKILINQTRSKYIRLDNVSILAKADLEIESVEFFANGTLLANEDIYKADKLELTFNQKVVEIPQLVISSESNEDIVVNGTVADNIVAYEFDALGFDIYTFTAQDFKSPTATECDFDVMRGYKLESNIPDKIHFGESYQVSDFGTQITAASGSASQAGELTVVSENTDAIAIENGALVLNKPGVSKMAISFVFNGQAIEMNRDIELCGAKSVIVPSESVNLQAGGFESFPISLELTDGTVIDTENITCESTDPTVAVIENGILKGLARGNAYINISVEYYGETVTKTVSVGVDKEALDTVSDAVIAVNRDTICVNESIQAIVSGAFEGDVEADSLSLNKKFYSSNENVVTVSDNGKITGKREGSADVYAIVNVGGVSIKSNTITINVEADRINKVEIIVPSSYMLKGEAAELGVRAYTKTGEEIANPEVIYKSSNYSLLKLANNVVSAISAGTARVYASVTYNGETVESEKVAVTVKESSASNNKDFILDPNYSGIYEYSNRTYISDAGGGIFTNGTDIHDEYIVLEGTDTIKNVYIRWDSYGARYTDDIRLHLSADNVNYVEVPEDDFNVKVVACQVTVAGTGYEYEYAGNLLEGMKYAKVYFDRKDGNNTQVTRLLGVRLDYDVAPEVIGVSGTSKRGLLTAGTDANELKVLFSMDIVPEKGGEITLKEKETGKVVDITTEYTDKIYEVSFDEMENVDHVLTVSGFKSKFNTPMEDFSVEIEPVVKDSVTVTNIGFSSQKVSASLVNNLDKAITVSIVTAVYDSEGIMTGMYVDSDYELAKGANNFVSGGTFTEGRTAKVYVWSDMIDMFVY